MWRKVTDLRFITHFSGHSLRVKVNCLSSNIVRGNSPWGVLFATCLWAIWKARCKRAIEGCFNSHTQVLHYAIKLCGDIVLAWERFDVIELNGKGESHIGKK